MVVVASIVGLLALLAVSALGWGIFRYGHVGLPVPAVILTLTLVVSAVFYAYSIRAELVRGGEAEVRLHRSHVELPPPFAGKALAFPIEQLELSILRVESRVLFASVATVESLRFRAPGLARTLSSRLFEAPEQLQWLAEDLAALKAGTPLPEHAERPSDPDAPRDAYDDRLDAELDALD